MRARKGTSGATGSGGKVVANRAAIPANSGRALAGAGKRAARTALERYGPEGLSAIARKAQASRRKWSARGLTEMERELLRSCPAKRRSAVERGLDCDDDLEEVALAMLADQSGRCALSGVAFRPDVLGHGKAPRPFMPSIDRRDATRGYTADNIRIVCWAANCLLGSWGDEAALEIARGMVSRSAGIGTK